MERESKRLAAHNLRPMPSRPRLTRRLRKSNRLLVLVKLRILTSIIKLGRRVRASGNSEPRLAGLRAVHGFLLGRGV
jgi:hypothetical protein